MSTLDHEHYMKEVIELACQNLKRPFASLIVDEDTGKTISLGLNRTHKCPVLHSEMMAIREAFDLKTPIDWERTILYTTAEPNPMNISAILWTGIPKVVYGTSLSYLHEIGYRQINIPAQEVVDRADGMDTTLVPGICQDQCDALFEAAVKIYKL